MAQHRAGQRQKNSLRGSYHHISGKHLPRYLGEFCYRFNRRFDLAAMFPQLGKAAVRKPPCRITSLNGLSYINNQVTLWHLQCVNGCF